jgi:hypothetical protein
VVCFDVSFFCFLVFVFCLNCRNALELIMFPSLLLCLPLYRPLTDNESRAISHTIATKPDHYVSFEEFASFLGRISSAAGSTRVITSDVYSLIGASPGVAQQLLESAQHELSIEREKNRKLEARVDRLKMRLSGASDEVSRLQTELDDATYATEAAKAELNQSKQLNDQYLEETTRINDIVCVCGVCLCVSVFLCLLVFGIVYSLRVLEY